MSDVRIVIDADQAAAAWRSITSGDLRNAARGTERAAHVIARAAKGKVSKVQSTLANSINVEQIAGLAEAEVGHQAAPGVAYAPYVEEGTGPAAGRPRYYPNPDALLDFISGNNTSRGFKWAPTGDFVRTTQKLELFNRARAMAWSIYMKGTKPAPFMGPATAEHTDAAFRYVRIAVEQGIAEVFGAT